MQLDQQQQEAVDAAVSNRFSIINGGAGTGKTTIISAICDVMEKQRNTQASIVDLNLKRLQLAAGVIR